jgi:hypothetical protein
MKSGPEGASAPAFRSGSPERVTVQAGQVLLSPHEVRAVLAGRMGSGRATLDRPGAESVEDLVMSEEHERRQRGAG